MVNWFRQYYQTHGRFPGMFGEFQRARLWPVPLIITLTHKSINKRIANKQWKDAAYDGNIPNGGNIIVVPVNLHTQFTLEIQKYLEHGTFDLFPYLLSTRNRQNFWKDIWPRSVYSKRGHNRKILLATCSVSCFLRVIFFSQPVSGTDLGLCYRPSSQICRSAFRSHREMKNWTIYGSPASRRRISAVRFSGKDGFACSRMKDSKPGNKVLSPLHFTNWLAGALGALSPPLRP